MRKTVITICLMETFWLYPSSLSYYISVSCLWECPDLCTHAILLSHKFSLSHFLLLCLSARYLFPPFYPSHIKAHNILSWVMIVFNKVVWHTPCCFTYERLITIKFYEIDPWNGSPENVIKIKIPFSIPHFFLRNVALVSPPCPLAFLSLIVTRLLMP